MERPSNVGFDHYLLKPVTSQTIESLLSLDPE